MRALYGMPWNADSLDNIEVGLQAGRKVDIQFRAPYTSTLVSVALAIAYGTGYSAGTGGSVKCDLQTDDGTASHFPSGTSLGSVTVTTTNGTPDTESIVTWTFATPIAVTLGTIYHLVFTQQDASPTTNWVSIDGTYNATPQAQLQPAFDNTDLCMNWSFSGGAWAAQTSISCAPLNLHFGNGLDWGWSVDYTPVAAALRNVGGASNAVRMNFTPSENLLVRSMWARLYRQSATSQPLSLQLKQGGTTIVQQGTVAASGIVALTAGASPADGTWVGVHFPDYQLRKAQQYTFELWSTAETTFYQAYPLRTAETGNWSAAALANRFNDGWWEYTVNGGSTWTQESSDTGYKMQFYFELASIPGLAFNRRQPMAVAA